ncbi:MAG: NAD-dependent epimerase/dehydratase family protein [Alphaproteobacteria bacterium]|nr:MAG: NAD-dependent epimerase/dehydratase family protein [Alphaproteobacteria bacterium]
MALLVTGGTGFVGSAVVRKLLARGEAVRVLVRPSSDLGNLVGLDVELAVGDLLQPASLRRALAGVHGLYHVAADYRLWARDPAMLYRVNIDGTCNLLACAGAADVARIVYTSSVATLGLDPTGASADEGTAVGLGDMIGDYKRSKFLAEQAVRAMAAGGLPVVIVNPSTPVGPGDIKPTPTGRTIREAVRGRMPAYVETGLNIVHVDDVAEGHLRAFDRGRIGERYILGGDNMLLCDILCAIAAITGGRAPVLRLPCGAILPFAWIAECFARFTGGKEPLLTCDGLKMARKKMFFTSAKAERELGYRHRPALAALRAAVAYFSPSTTPAAV